MLMPLTSVKAIKKSCCISFWSSWTDKCNGATDDANTGITWPKTSCLTLFQSYWPNKLVPLTVASVSCKTYNATNCITWWKESCNALSQLSLPNEENQTIYDVVSITWEQCWYWWYHMTKRSCFTYFDYCDLMNVMVPLTTPLASQVCLDIVSTCQDMCKISHSLDFPYNSWMYSHNRILVWKQTSFHPLLWTSSGLRTTQHSCNL